MFPCGSIHQNCPLNICTAKKTDSLCFHRAYPIRYAVVVNLKIAAADHGCGITETHITIQIPSEVFKGRILDALSFRQLHQFHILCGHVDVHVCRNTCIAVSDPFDNVTVFQWCHTNRFAVQVDLVVVIADFILGNHVHHGTHFTFSQFCGGIAVQNGNLAVIHFVDILREITVLHCQQRAVCRCPQNGRRQKHPYPINDHQRQRDIEQFFQ